MIVKWYTTDITEYVEKITWSGSGKQAGRTLEITVLYAPNDPNIKTPNIKPGDTLKLLTDDRKLLIQAMVYNRGRQSKAGTITYKAFDGLNRLVRNKGTYNFKNTTAEKITALVCKDINMQAGNIINTNVPIASLLVEGESFYNIIMKAYTRAYLVNGRKYMPIMTGKELNVIEKGQIVDGFVLSDDSNITDSSYEETIDGVVNKIRIYDDNGKQIGEVKDADSIEKYGIFQDVYNKQEGENATVAAKEMLSGSEQTASVSALGNVECISGFGVKIKDSATGLVGIFWIENDTHTWSNGIHTMNLNIAFNNLMDVQTSDDVEDGGLAWIGTTSNKYHAKTTCSNLKSPTQISKDDAVAQGYTACKKCY